MRGSPGQEARLTFGLPPRPVWEWLLFGSLPPSLKGARRKPPPSAWAFPAAICFARSANFTAARADQPRAIAHAWASSDFTPWPPSCKVSRTATARRRSPLLACRLVTFTVAVSTSSPFTATGSQMISGSGLVASFSVGGSMTGR
jgi:hypothetical protein